MLTYAEGKFLTRIMYLAKPLMKYKRRIMTFTHMSKELLPNLPFSDSIKWGSKLKKRKTWDQGNRNSNLGYHSRLLVRGNTGMIFSVSLHHNQSRLGKEDRSSQWVAQRKRNSCNWWIMWCLTILRSVGDFCNTLVIAEADNSMKNKLYKLWVVIIIKYVAQVQTIFTKS